MAKRRNSRKLAMRLLYQVSIRDSDLMTLYDDLETDQYAPETLDWALVIAQKTVEKLIEIDDVIKQYSIDWEPDRLNRVDFSLLRIAIAEIHYLKVPYPVVINEIIELSKIYSTDESPKFINGILNSYVKVTATPVDPPNNTHDDTNNANP